MGGFQNFAISFTIISILAGCLTSYSIAYLQGGPIAVSWGWLLVGLMSTLVALSMAEIASAYPTAGGLYYWASKLGSPAWGWFTGWFNLVGQIAVTASIGYGLAIFSTALLNYWFDYPNTKGVRLPLIRGRAGSGPRDQPVQGQLHGNAEHDLRLLAHDRRGRSRRRPIHRSRHPPLIQLGLHGHGQRDRLGQWHDVGVHLLLRLPHRPADGPVHDHGLRRLGSRRRGDAQCVAGGGGRYVHVGRRIGHLRLHPARGRRPGRCLSSHSSTSTSSPRAGSQRWARAGGRSCSSSAASPRCSA